MAPEPATQERAPSPAPTAAQPEGPADRRAHPHSLGHDLSLAGRRAETDIELQHADEHRPCHIGQTLAVRRTIASLLFGLAFIGISLSIGGWLLQRTAFSPDRTADTSEAVLQDPQIRAQVVDIVANATADSLCKTPETAPICGSPDKVRGYIVGLLDAPATSAAMSRQMAGILREAHAHLIGEQHGPVQITDTQMRDIVFSDAVIGLPPVTLPVPEIGVLSVTRQVLHWLIPVAGLGGLLLGLIAFAAHPERAVLLRSAAFGMVLLAVLIMGLGYLVPRFLVPALSKSPWARVPGRVADQSLALFAAVSFVLVGAGLAVLVASGMARRRRRWSTPVNTHRYNEERSWM